ncbi:DUF1573 domain-containing protein [Botryobacter ruber]|uniref:DUF1573 domain-containing protein n=1 Tax=Botryobacter ruber TaxID=2171629 RepID=UPI000E0C870F|nr:DUF1573 domain-containing protein [Botryobacter ruber]
MKKNLFFSCALAAALLTAGCEQSNTASNTPTASETVTTESEAVVDNPNVVSTEGESASAENAPVIEFEEPVFDFGTVKQGEVVHHAFKFKNTGKSPLIIQSASASCGCTVPEPPKDPIAPGETGEIKVQFNTSGKMGQQSPTVEVRANTQPSIVQVSMKGTVEASKIPTAGPEGPVRRN